MILLDLLSIILLPLILLGVGCIVQIVVNDNYTLREVYQTRKKYNHTKRQSENSSEWLQLKLGVVLLLVGLTALIFRIYFI